MERIYGEAVVTPNMHLYMDTSKMLFWTMVLYKSSGVFHLKGIMEFLVRKQPTNNHAIEPQLLQQFLLDNLSGSYDFPDEFSEDFASLDLAQ